MRGFLVLDETIKMFCCPYCGNELFNAEDACCGEAGHGEHVYINEFGEEIDILKEIV